MSLSGRRAALAARVFEPKAASHNNCSWKMVLRVALRIALCNADGLVGHRAGRRKFFNLLIAVACDRQPLVGGTKPWPTVRQPPRPPLRIGKTADGSVNPPIRRRSPLSPQHATAKSPQPSRHGERLTSRGFLHNNGPSTQEEVQVPSYWNDNIIPPREYSDLSRSVIPDALQQSSWCSAVPGSCSRL